MNNIEEMEMPCPCKKCGEWFDLEDGKQSMKWFPNTVICESCENLEATEIERDEEVEDATTMLHNAIIDLKQAQEEMNRLNQPLTESVAYTQYITEHNMDVISSFIEHVKVESGIEIAEEHMLSFFDA